MISIKTSEIKLMDICQNNLPFLAKLISLFCICCNFITSCCLKRSGESIKENGNDQEDVTPEVLLRELKIGFACNRIIRFLEQS